MDITQMGTVLAIVVIAYLVGLGAKLISAIPDEAIPVIVGVAGGIASSGATTAAVMALGTASTGTAISTLSGAAATNATLAALGGGAIGSTTAAGGMALGTTVLGASTLGVGLLIGGVVFNFTGKKMANKADEAYRQAKKSEKEAEEICSYLENLDRAALRFSEALKSVSDIYERNLRDMETIVISLNRTNWNDFNDREKKICENTALLVGYLYKMCRVAIVKNENNSNGFNTINYDEVNSAITDGKAQIEGDFTAEEATALAEKIEAGALPFQLQTANYSQISPTLGENSLTAMAYAGVIALIAIALIMIIFYRLPGFIAVISLLGQMGLSIAAISGYFTTIPSFAAINEAPIGAEISTPV